jgi:lipoprotein signal peptidase
MDHNWRDTIRSPIALLCFLGTFVVGLTLDLISKSLAMTHLKTSPGEDPRIIRIIPWIVRFEYTENLGAVFGMGKGQRPLFLLVSVLAIGLLVYLFATSGKLRTYQVILGMLLAGVLGNMYDRVRYGFVRDMIHGLPGVTWPGWVVNLLPETWRTPSGRMEVFPWIFNIADSLLCVGVVTMIVYTFISERHRKYLLKVAEAAGA